METLLVKKLANSVFGAREAHRHAQPFGRARQQRIFFHPDFGRR
jgi:hypothetical protein